MNKIITVALAATLLASTASIAFAQAPVDATAGDTSASVAVEGGAPVDLSTVTEKTSVGIVLMSSLQGAASGDAQALDAEALETLHASVEENAAIKAKLDAEGIAVSDVIAVANNVDGSIIVYVDDRA